jgi:hypothetical protein
MTGTPPAAPAPPLAEVILAGLRAALPGWHIARTPTGRWHATRRDPLPPGRRPPGYALTLTADSPRLLARRITSQPDRPVFRQQPITTPRLPPPLTVADLTARYAGQWHIYADRFSYSAMRRPTPTAREILTADTPERLAAKIDAEP